MDISTRGSSRKKLIFNATRSFTKKVSRRRMNDGNEE
jgi:hypothetical protein